MNQPSIQHNTYLYLHFQFQFYLSTFNIFKIRSAGNCLYYSISQLIKASLGFKRVCDIQSETY